MSINRPSELTNYRWQIAPPVPPSLIQELGHFNPILLQVLYNRGLSKPADIQAFLEGRYLAKDDPFLLADMDKAVARIQHAVEQGQNVIVYGDFDADGVTATVLLVEALRGLGLSREQAQPYIPGRVDEGYGLNFDALSKLKGRGADLVISVDCGIRSVAEVAHARDIGLDMIITDHHSLGRELPPAGAVINPKRPDSAYPETMLAGVGIAYKLAQALCQAMPQRVQFDPSQLLDLVAIGTVADIAPLLGENRKLVIEGLKVLNGATRPGIAALAQISGLTPGSMTAESIGFRLGPRINAAGRLAHAYSAARLLIADNAPTAERLAHELNQLNQQRQALTAELCDMAEGLIQPDANILIAADTGFVSGVVGLVAGRLAEKYYRPAVVIETGSEESRGSCRSITEFHITEALDEVAHLLVRHGGHAQAAGFTVRNENLPQFRQALSDIAARELSGRELVPTLAIDAELPLRQVDWALHDLLQQLEPTGCANATPVFMARHAQVFNHRAVGQDGGHLQLQVGDGQRGFGAIAFRQAAWADQMPGRVDIVYTINVNEWRGQRSLQLRVEDLRPSETT